MMTHRRRVQRWRRKR